MFAFRTATCRGAVLSLACLLVLFPTLGAQVASEKQAPGPMLDASTVSLRTPALTLTLLRSSQTAAALNPVAQSNIDYTPGELLAERSQNGYYHLGDLDLRLKSGDAGPWKDYSTAYERHPVRNLAVTPDQISADLAPTLPADIPLAVSRTWSTSHGELILRFTLTNRSTQPVHVGGLGIPMVFDNVLTGKTLEQAYARCSFYDPSIAEDAGYLQVVRLNGLGPVLLVVPDQHTAFEAYKPILDELAPGGGPLLLNDPTPRGTTFEGFFDWMVHSAGFATNEWKGAEEWNPPSEAVLAPGASRTYGVRFLVAPSVRTIEDTLSLHHRPVAVGVPGYILPQDIRARLFLRYATPVQSIVSEPANAITIHDDGNATAGWHAYTLQGKEWGRARMVITYADGVVQSIPYRTIKPERQVAGDLGRFLFHQQWFNQPDDPFHRAPSIISYDNEAGHQITQEPRVWIAGLSDEAGAGSWIAAAMKEEAQPDPEEVARLEQFVDGTLWGHLQSSAGANKYSVRKSLFAYQPDAMPPGYYNPNDDWKSWTSWNSQAAAAVDRSFNYTHVVAAYWALYRIARNTYGVSTRHPWSWYLNQAYQTTLAMRQQAEGYTQFGQMEGTVFLRLLEDMQREGWTKKAATLESLLRERADHWRSEAYPFGSEMPWDSTGQEEVYAWTRYFGFIDKADVTLNAILAYTPVVPSWGYNGSARRYWDFVYAGKYERIERQLHHYGSGLNAIPLLTEYRSHPADIYLLRAGYGGVMGPLANIDQKGFGSAAFHSFPDKMRYDPYTGDYGPNFLGHTLNTGTYVVQHPALGWLCFGGNVVAHGHTIAITPLDSARSRVFIAPIGLWLELDAGQFSRVLYNTADRSVVLSFAPATAQVPIARLRISQTISGNAHYRPSASLPMDAAAYTLPLTAGAQQLRLVATTSSGPN